MTNRAKSLVKETSATIGTGSYALAGAFAGFRTFNSAAAASTTTFFPYVARMGAQFEIGIGKLSAATTLERFAVVESSNANAAVNWGVGTKDVYCATGGNWGPQGKHNFDAGAPPVYNVDTYAAGYGVGSLWYYGTRNLLWVCIGDGSYASSGGFAIWRLISSPGFGPLQTTGGADASGALDLSGGQGLTDDAGLQQSVAFGEAARVKHSRVKAHGFGFAAGATYGAFQNVEAGFIAITTNATATDANLFGYGPTDFIMPPSCAWRLEARVVARCDVDNTSKEWLVTALIQRAGAAASAFVGSPSVVSTFASAAAAAWALGISLGISGETAGINDAPVFTATGAAAKTIRWTVECRVVQVANY